MAKAPDSAARHSATHGHPREDGVGQWHSGAACSAFSLRAARFCWKALRIYESVTNRRQSYTNEALASGHDSPLCGAALQSLARSGSRSAHVQVLAPCPTFVTPCLAHNQGRNPGPRPAQHPGFRRRGSIPTLGEWLPAEHPAAQEQARRNLQVRCAA